MSLTRGVIYVAYGKQARDQVLLSAKSLAHSNPRLPFRVISDRGFDRVAGFPGIRTIYRDDADPGARLAKLNVDTMSPFDLTAYIDADTRIQRDISWPFTLLEAGWEMAMAPGAYQGDEAHGHVNEEEREATFREIGRGCHVLQAGVIFFRKCDAVHELFSAWRNEWYRWQDQDQAALLRALVRVPVRLFLLDRAYNDPQGSIIRHYCGFARRRGLKHSRGNAL